MAIVSTIVGTLVSYGVGALMDNLLSSKEHKTAWDYQQELIKKHRESYHQRLRMYLDQSSKKIEKEASERYYLERFYHIWDEIKQNFFYSFLFYLFFCVGLYEILKTYKE